MEKLIEMNDEMLQKIAIIKKENKTLLCITENLTGTTNKPQHKHSTKLLDTVACMGITLSMDKPAKLVHPNHMATRRKQPEPIQSK